MTDPLPLVSIENESLRAVFAPTRGGRLLSLRVGEEELLWQNPALLDEDLRPLAPIESWPRGDGGMSTWANVGGSKTWPAPQGWSGPDEWAGPPDPVLDAGEWEVVGHTDTSINLRSGFDTRSGLRVEKSFSLATGGLVERITFTNESDRTTHWSPWEVCQVRTESGGSVLVVGASAEDERDLGTWEGVVTSEGTRHGVVLEVGTGVGKRGYTGGRAIAFRGSSGTTIALSSADEPADDAPYPDGGALFEVWLQRPVTDPLVDLDGLRPDAHLVELEVLGRRTPLPPAGARTTTISWTINTTPTARQ